MAVTEIWPINVRLDKFIAYVVNKDKTVNVGFEADQALNALLAYDTNELKTEKKLFVTGINCELENAYECMRAAWALNDKPMPNIAYHAYQSFQSGEVDAKTAHEIGIKLAEKLWGDKFQVVVATHLNTEHYHNHFAICSTSFIDGKRYHDDNKSKGRMRAASDELCREYGLSVIENRKNQRNKNYAERIAEKNGMPTLISQMKEDIDKAIAEAMTREQFFSGLKMMGYTMVFRGNHKDELNRGHYIDIDTDREKDVIFTLVPPGYAHPWRPSNHFGMEYSYSALVKRAEQEKQMPYMREERIKPVHLRHGAEDFVKCTTLHAIYIHTLYQFGLIPKKNNNRRVPIELREDLIKLNSIIEETRLLGRNHIDTAGQLSLYRGQTEEKITELTDKRQKLRNRLRRCTDEDEIKAVKSRVSDISSELIKLRREVKYCDNIAERSGILKEKLSQIYENEKMKRKDDRTNEQFR
ncbi:MAG: relaxase/mobilization nuclease domain-containing protein [Eubacteriales bacterium]|nr:relaxase/mobilization nuclease domain-containing protein [Eubacteriales bacterium]